MVMMERREGGRRKGVYKGLEPGGTGSHALSHNLLNAFADEVVNREVKIQVRTLSHW